MKNLYIVWPREVSSAASLGFFLDLASVQVILGIDVILNLIHRFPYFDYGWTFSFSAPNATGRGALLRKLFRLFSFPYRI